MHLQKNKQCPVVKLHLSIGWAAKRFHLIIAPKRCFTTVLVFLFYFYEGIIFFLPFSAFPASVYILFTAFSPEFSWKRSVFPPQEFYDSLRECWDTKHSSCARSGDTTPRKGMGMEEQWRHFLCKYFNFTGHLKPCPNVTGSGYCPPRERVAYLLSSFVLPDLMTMMSSVWA